MNTDSPHEPWADQRVTAYVLGELGPTEISAFERQLERDPDLAAAVEEAKGITNQLKSWFAEEAPLALDPERRQSIFGALVSPPPVDAAAAVPPVTELPNQFGRSHGAAVRWMALAATVILAVGAIGYQWVARSQAERRERVLALVESSRSEQESATDPASLATQEPARSERLSKQLAEENIGELAESESAEVSSSELAEQRSLPTINRFSSQLLEAETLADRSANSALGIEPAPTESNRTLQQFDATASSDDALMSEAIAKPEGRADLKIAGSPRSRAQTAASSELQAEVPLRAEASRSVTMDFAQPMDKLNEVDADLPAGPAAAIEFRQEQGANVYAYEPLGTDMYGGAVAEPSFNRPTEALGDAASPAFAGSGARSGRDVAPLAAPATTPLSLAFGREPEAQGFGLRGTERRWDEGRGPGMSGDQFAPIIENPFKRVGEHPLSTFSIDVDTASYSKVRQFLVDSGQLPRPDVVRIEELVNYFDYGYAEPPADSPHPLVSDIEIAQCPWYTDHRLARIAVQARRVAEQDRPASNLVFLIDTSGSMNMPNRLPLVKQGLEMLLDQLKASDRVAMVVYAGSAGLVLDSTPATDVSQIRRALTRLEAGGSTNGGDGIRLAYQTARDHFIAGGINRVILCTDGDFNVGTTSPDELVQLVEQQARGGIDLTVLGFGMGNHNDAMLEQISGRGNGNYAFIDHVQEARRILVERATSTLFTVARDVKIQVEFNPSQVAAYRLIGYENRILAKEDFKDDTKDAGEVGAGHSVTALYELIPHDGNTDVLPPVVDELKYQRPLTTAEVAKSDEVLTLKIRYKPVEVAVKASDRPAGESIAIEFPAKDSGKTFSQASESYRFATLVAAFGLQLRRSEHRGNWTLADVQREASALGGVQDAARIEWLDLLRRATELQVAEPTRN